MWNQYFEGLLQGLIKVESTDIELLRLASQVNVSLYPVSRLQRFYAYKPGPLIVNQDSLIRVQIPTSISGLGRIFLKSKNV